MNYNKIHERLVINKAGVKRKKRGKSKKSN